jgi:predicted GNAT family acetyltransferase
VLATIHRLSTRARADAPPDSGVVVLAPPDGELVSRLPADMRREAPYATAMALRLAGGSPVSVCQATAVTETLWDAGVQRAEGHRRRGHAAACFRALAAYMAAAGKEPVWGAEEGNRASIELARKLGFEPAERVAIMRPPAG